MNPSPLVLIILDGWGLAPPGPGNAIAAARKPNMDKYWAVYPHTQLIASGEAVGLPKGTDGNSETGHLNLGAGRIVYQDLPRINFSIADGSFFANPALLQACKHVQKHHSTLHLLGLMGSGGVHANNEHLYALLRLAKEKEVNHVVLHLITDGRDSPPTSAQIYWEEVKAKLAEFGIGCVGTLMGRYWAMDRDNRWSRTQKAYLALTEGQGRLAFSAQEAIQKAYDKDETDEFIQPSVIVDANRIPIGLIKNNDAVIFYNFRVDRPRQLTKAFVLKNFTQDATKISFDPYFDKYLLSQVKQEGRLQEPPFVRHLYLENLFFVTLTEYEKDLPVSSVAFPPQKLPLPLAQVLSENGLKQIHISETEKERFVTYYFNGFHERPFPGEIWLTVPSKKVPTYDLEPQMSAPEITAKVLEKINSQEDFRFILVNFANPDMVGHTAKMTSCVKSIEAVDECVGKIVAAVQAISGTVMITADHGNAEELINADSGEIDTEHSANNVPFILINHFEGCPRQLPRGILGDVASTILKILQIPKPSLMTGKSLI